MLEKQIENFLKTQVEARGGRCVKLDTSSERGMPDRLCILPYGQVMFVETKRPKGGRLSKYQEHIIQKLNGLGVRAYVASSKEEVDILMKKYDVRLHHLMEDE